MAVKQNWFSAIDNRENEDIVLKGRLSMGVTPAPAVPTGPLAKVRLPCTALSQQDPEKSYITVGFFIVL